MSYRSVTIATGLLLSLVATTAPAQTRCCVAYNTQPYSYAQAQADYARAMADYRAARQQYERDRAAWERSHGANQYYDPRPVYGNAGAPPVYNAPGAYSGPVCEASRNRTGGTILGAIVGGALGAAAAGDSSETEGAVLGAVVGGTLGYNLSSGGATAGRYEPQCDRDGFFYTRDQTFYYRESQMNRGRRDGRMGYNAYVQADCRLAVAPHAGTSQYHYVRVCPDNRGRYRITY